MESYSIYKHDAIDIADPSSMQDACNMNFVIDLAHRRVFCDLVVEHRSAEFEGLRFDSSWGLRSFSFSISLPSSKLTSSLIPYRNSHVFVSCFIREPCGYDRACAVHACRYCRWYC